MMNVILGTLVLPIDLRHLMKIIMWNCQGAGKRSFTVYCLGLKLSYRPHVMFFMETRVSARSAEHIIPTLGYSDHFRVPSEGFAGGI